jgi:hypothetical protein
MVHGILIAAVLTLVGDNGSGNQVPAPAPTQQSAQHHVSSCEAAFRQSDLAKRLEEYGSASVIPPVMCAPPPNPAPLPGQRPPNVEYKVLPGQAGRRNGV